MQSQKLFHLIGFATVLLATTALTWADGAPAVDLLHDRFTVDLGTYIVSSNLNGSLRGSANTTNQPIDFDKQFGTDADQTRWRVDIMWRITERQHLRFMYFDNDVTKTRTIDRDLEWGDYTFLANGAVTTESKFRVYELGYEFAFLRRENYEIVGTAGIHFDDMTIKLSGNASVTVGGVQQTAMFATKESSVPAPLPVLGVRGDWAVTDHIYLDAGLQVFKLSYQGIDGNWTDLRAGAAWMFNHHFGIGVGFDRFATHVNLSKGSFDGRLNFGYQGALLYVRGGF